MPNFIGWYFAIIVFFILFAVHTYAPLLAHTISSIAIALYVGVSLSEAIEPKNEPKPLPPPVVSKVVPPDFSAQIKQILDKYKK